MSARILVVDDEPSVLSGLRRALTLESYDVAVAENGEAALELADTQDPDLIVLDVMLPDMDGFAVCEHIREKGSTPVLMLSARDTVPDRVAGLEHGADDYLVKPFALNELIARIRALLRRADPEKGQTLSYGDVSINLAAHEASRGGHVLRLAPREYDLLELFLRHRGQALSRDRLCQQVWGYGFEGESNFVDVAIKELRKKLEEHGGERVIQTVRGFGYILKAH
jgi:two-component system response regulator MprA